MDVGVTIFQEEWMKRGMNFGDEEVPKNVEYCTAYTAVAMGECLETIDKVNEAWLNEDLKVNTLLPSLLTLS